MATICIFYDSSDFELVKKLKIKLQKIKGCEPWFADGRSSHNWEKEIVTLSQSPECVGAVVFWNEASVNNQIIIDETRLMNKAGKIVLNVLLDNGIDIPLGLSNAIRFKPKSQNDDDIIDEVVLDVQERLLNGKEGDRILKLGNKSLLAPTVIFSVSSFETQVAADPCLDLLFACEPKAILISAYDLLRRVSEKAGIITEKSEIRNIDAILKMRKKGTIVVLDSGNYEAKRYRDASWQKSKKRLYEAQELVDVDLAFTHDRFPDNEFYKTKDFFLNSKEIIETRINEVVAEYLRDNKIMSCEVAPIIHVPKNNGNIYASDLLPEICLGVIERCNPQMIAVAERELGDGIYKRVETVLKIREKLSQRNSQAFLHILGTGNPISAAMLSMAGADFFDGLEWCRTAIDGNRWRLYHFQQWDMFSSQSGLLKDDEAAQIVKDTSGRMPWIFKTMVHNITFMKQFNEILQDTHKRNEFESFFKSTLDFGQLYHELNGIIQEHKNGNYK